MGILKAIFGKKKKRKVNASTELLLLAKRRPGMLIKTNHPHPVGYHRGINSVLNAQKASRKRAKK